MLFGAFASVAVATEHLAVFFYGLSTLAPRYDMVGVHFFKFKGFSAHRALMALFFVLEFYQVCFFI